MSWSWQGYVWLEVCKSLNLSSDFLSRAHSLRMKYNPKETNILSTEGSRYNANKKVHEMCGSEGEEVHHLVHQSEADESGYVGSFHKNHPANLQNVAKNVTINYTKQESNIAKQKHPMVIIF